MKCYYVTPISTTYDRDTMVSPDAVNTVRDNIQKEIRELIGFTEAYEKIKASHTKEIEMMKKDSIKQREDMTKIKNINLHLTNEVNTKNDEIVCCAGYPVCLISTKSN